MELVIFLGTLFLFLFMGIPIALVMVLSAICLMIYSGFWDYMIIPQAMVDGVNNYPLMAIPSSSSQAKSWPKAGSPSAWCCSPS